MIVRPCVRLRRRFGNKISCKSFIGSGSLCVVLADICGGSLISFKLLVDTHILLEGVSDIITVNSTFIA